MRALLLTLLLCAGVSLASCSKAVENCSSESTKSTVLDIVKNQLEKASKEQVKSPGDGRPVSNSKIRATIGQLKIAVTDIRTTKEDPDSTKRFCVGNLKVTVPSTVIEDANEARELAGADPISTLADQNEIEQNADTFQTSIDFNVQPTDDGSNLYGEIEDGDKVFAFFGEVLASHLLKTRIQNAKFLEDRTAEEQRKQEAAAQREQDAAVTEQGNAEIAVARSENKMASDAINAVWRNIPSSTRNRLFDLQKAWMRKKNADCVIESASSSTGPAAREAARLQCDTRAVYQRASSLRQFVAEEPVDDSADYSAAESEEVGEEGSGNITNAM